MDAAIPYVTDFALEASNLPGLAAVGSVDEDHSSSTLSSDPRALRDTLSSFATGVALVAAQVDGRPVGLLANSFTSVSLDPPLVSVSIGLRSPTLKLIERAPQWGISVLGEQHASTFEKLARRSDTRFEGVDLAAGLRGGLLLPDAIGRFIVAREAEIEAGDHLLLLLRVLEHAHLPAAAPLVFHGSTLRRLAT